MSFKGLSEEVERTSPQEAAQLANAAWSASPAPSQAAYAETTYDPAVLQALSQAIVADAEGFEAISESLSLGISSLAVAQNAAESVVHLLGLVKDKILAAQRQDADRGALQDDITALRNQIDSIVRAARFNSTNLLSNRDNTVGSGVMAISALPECTADGVLQPSNIIVKKHDLGLQASDWERASPALPRSAMHLSGDLAGEGGAALKGAKGAAASATLVINGSVAGMGISLEIGGASGKIGRAFENGAHGVSYIARDGDRPADIAHALTHGFNAWVWMAKGAGALVEKSTMKADFQIAENGAAIIVITGEQGSGNDFILTAVQSHNVANGGGLEGLSSIDVRTHRRARAAMPMIDRLMQTALRAAKDFARARGRGETQKALLNRLTVGIKSRIGSAIEANMEEDAVRQHALHVQQQLAAQSLAIANQRPQTGFSAPLR